MAIATIKPPSDFAGLVRVHQAGVWRYLRFLGADEAQADDLTQETFLSVYRRPFVEQSPAATAAYLRTVARRQFMMSIRKSKRQPALANLELADEVWSRLAGDDGGGYLEALRDCLQSLDGRVRQAIELRYRDDRSRADIGRLLEIGEDGVKSLLRRTREVLRGCVEKRVRES
ncbi:MAG TPA: RNA polymerase sigma factor [Pirellulales bacterium]|nr:RNA polymerase sigma factor [Pirellulales bacterium]